MKATSSKWLLGEERRLFGGKTDLRIKPGLYSFQALEFQTSAFSSLLSISSVTDCRKQQPCNTANKASANSRDLSPICSEVFVFAQLCAEHRCEAGNTAGDKTYSLALDLTGSWETDSKQTQSERVIYRQRVTAGDNRGGAAVRRGWNDLEHLLGVAVILRKLLYLHIPTVQQVSGLNKGRASSLTRHQGWFHGSASQGQPGTQTPSTSWLCSLLQSPRSATPSTPHRRLREGREGEGGATRLPFRKRLAVAHTLCLPIHQPAGTKPHGHTYLPGGLGNRNFILRPS